MKAWQLHIKNWIQFCETPSSQLINQKLCWYAQLYYLPLAENENKTRTDANKKSTRAKTEKHKQGKPVQDFFAASTMSICESSRVPADGASLKINYVIHALILRRSLNRNEN